MNFRVKKEQDKHSAILTLWIFALCIKQIITQQPITTVVNAMNNNNNKIKVFMKTQWGSNLV